MLNDWDIADPFHNVEQKLHTIGKMKVKPASNGFFTVTKGASESLKREVEPVGADLGQSRGTQRGEEPLSDEKDDHPFIVRSWTETNFSDEPRKSTCPFRRRRNVSPKRVQKG